MSLRSLVVAEFIKRFGIPPIWLASSPGRVNLIGEHTDYNDGFVLPMAINYACWVALRPRTDSKVLAYSLDLEDSLEFDLARFAKGTSSWQEYIKGIAWSLQRAGYPLSGWEGVFAGDVPIGAGLSSSAALELAVSMSFSLSSGFEWQPKKMAETAQQAENQWVGVNCGIMDQMISAAGLKDTALLIDCRTLKTTIVPLPNGASFVILDTNTRRGLVDSAYNERREQCEAVARHFGVPALRDVHLDQLLAAQDALEDVLFRRARHVCSENQRVLQAVEVLQQGDTRGFGQLMNASQVSLRDDFEVSREEMDSMVEIAQSQAGCLGARMTGGGFGGCVVAFVEDELINAFIENVSGAYRQRVGLDAKIYKSSASTGTNFENLAAI